MQTDQQKRILGYFIEEAQEHLTTIENSLMNLQGVVDDPEAMSEMFRAAHSVKGGAAMLGLFSIQQISHKLEDYFKVLKENPIRVDETLESLFLQGFDALRELLDELQSPFGLSDEVANQALNQTEPVFAQLEIHLNSIVSGTPALAVIAPPVTTPSEPTPAEPSDGREFVFQTDVPERLRAMLQLFKQPDSPAVRRSLQDACVSLGQLGEPFELQAWVKLLEAAEQAVGHSDNSLLVLAPILIKEIKGARDLVLAGHVNDIQASDQLLALIPTAPELPSQSLADTSTLATVQSLPPLQASEVAPATTHDDLTTPDSEYVAQVDTVAEVAPPTELAGDEDATSQVSWEAPVEDLEELGDIFELSGELSPPWPGFEAEFATEQPAASSAFDEDLSEFLEPSPTVSSANEPGLDLVELFGTETDLVADFAQELGDIDLAGIGEARADAVLGDEEVDLATFFAEAPVDVSSEVEVGEPEGVEGAVSNLPTDLSDLNIPDDSAGLSALIDNLLEGIDPGVNNLAADADFLDTFLTEELGAELTGEDVVQPQLPTAEELWSDSTDVDAVLEELVAAPEAELELESLPETPPDQAWDSEELATSADLEAFIAATADAPPEAEPISEIDNVLEDLSEISEIIAGPLTAPEASPEIAEPASFDFDDLDALLAEPNAPAPAATTPAWDDLESLLEPDSTTAAANSLDDLESLLDDMAPTPVSNASAPGLEIEPPTPASTQSFTMRPRTARRGSSAGFEQTMRVSVKHLDGLNNLVGEMVVNRNALEDSQERLRQFLDNLLYQVQQLGDVSQQMQDLYDRSLLESSLLRGISTPFNHGGSSGREDSSHATGVEFDSLEMDRFTGFHTLSQEVIERIVRVREAASDIEYVVDEVEQTTRMFRQVTTQVQESLSRSRMVPFREMATRLPGAVRQIASKCGKQCSLEIEGEGILVDKGILERLYDPMTHLINNAIYHGIETPEERQAKGKSEKGTVKIRAFYQGSQTIISVSDDGNGIDADRVKAKAISTGIVTAEEAQHLSRQDIYGLLFRSGFSTKDQADELAGRGVGMDVVRVSLEEIRGSINTDSTLGKGTTFTIRLPLTLSITKALCCIDNHCRIAFPIDGVEDMLDLPEDRLQLTDDGERKLVWRDRHLTFRKLTDLLPYRRQISRSNVYGGAGHEEDVISVVILRSGDDLIALQVDQVIGEQEIVIKQLSGPVPKPIGIAGVTVQGDGRAMAIADILELVDLSLNRLEPGDWGTPMPSLPQEPVKTEPLVLIIDDSITVRELLSMTFTRAGYRVEQARDGQDAWEKLRSGLPCDLVFCDIEMPRMDGLELLSRMQKDANLKQLPIAMLTSRGADRHRQMAAQLGARGYFTKPYLEEQLLDAASRLLKGEVLVSEPVA